MPYQYHSLHHFHQQIHQYAENTPQISLLIDLLRTRQQNDPAYYVYELESYLSHKLLGLAPEQISKSASYGFLPGQTPFRSDHVLHFTANHYLLSHTTNTEVAQLLYDIHNIYTSVEKNPLPDLPNDLNEIVTAVRQLPIPKSIQYNWCKKSAIYNLSETIVRVLNDLQDSSQMVWTYDDYKKEKNAIHSELYHSTAFCEYYLLCRQEGSVPLVLILYYDDFRKFAKVAGSAGALYYTFANYNRDYISDTSHIYLGALVHQDDEVWDVISNIVDQLVGLYKPMRVFNRAVNKEIQVRTFLGMFLGDTPQRADFASLKRQNSNHPCVHCITEYDKQHSDEIKTLRNVTTTQQEFKKWQTATTQQERNNIEAETGIKPQLLPNSATIRVNPFWKLKRLYGFDIHVDSVVDWFHIGPIGIFKRYIKYLHEKVLNAKEVARLEKLAQSDEFKIFGRTLPRYKVRLNLIPT
jgi:hypothetical protein